MTNYEKYKYTYLKIWLLVALLEYLLTCLGLPNTIVDYVLLHVVPLLGY